MNKNIILAAACSYDILDTAGNYVQNITIVDNCHMGNMQGFFAFIEYLGYKLVARKSLGDRGQSFIEESGNFHNRSDAYKIAIGSGQPFNSSYVLPNNKLDSSCIRHFPVDQNLCGDCCGGAYDEF